MADQGLKHNSSNLINQVGVISNSYTNKLPYTQFNLNSLGIIDSSILSGSTTYVDAYKYFSCDNITAIPVHQSPISNHYIHDTNNYSNITIPYNYEIILNSEESVYFYITYGANRSESPMMLYDSINSIEGPSLNVPDVPDVIALLLRDDNSKLYKLELRNMGSVQRRFRLNTGSLLLRMYNQYFPFVDPSSVVIPYRPNYVDSTTWGDYSFIPHYRGDGKYLSGMNIYMKNPGDSILLELCAGGGGGAQNYAGGDATGAAGGGAGGYMCIYIQSLSSRIQGSLYYLENLKITVGEAGVSEDYFYDKAPTQGGHTSLDIVVNDNNSEKSFRLFTCEGGFNASPVRDDQHNTFQRGGAGGRVSYGKDIVYPAAYDHYKDHNIWAYNESKNNNKPSSNSFFPLEGCVLYNTSSKTIRIITTSMDKVDYYEIPLLRFKVLSVIYGGSGGSYMIREGTASLRGQNYLYINAGSPYSSGQMAATNGSFAGCRIVGADNYTWKANESGSSYNNSISNYNILRDISGEYIGNSLARCRGSTQYLFNEGNSNKCYCAGGGASALSFVTYVPYSSTGIYQLNTGNSQLDYKEYVWSDGYGYGGGGGYHSKKDGVINRMRSDPGSGVAIIHYPGSRFSFGKLSRPSNIDIEEF